MSLRPIVGPDSCDAEAMVTRMARHMRAEMAANRFKGDAWCELDAEAHEFELLYHALKLIFASRAKDKAAIVEHAADVGNCAGMLADAAGAWPSHALPPTGNLSDYALGTSGVRSLAEHILLEVMPAGPMYDAGTHGVPPKG